ncbi:unnamed protein product, partial [Prunus brigantina]
HFHASSSSFFIFSISASHQGTVVALAAAHNICFRARPICDALKLLFRCLTHILCSAVGSTLSMAGTSPFCLSLITTQACPFAIPKSSIRRLKNQIQESLLSISTTA